MIKLFFDTETTGFKTPDHTPRLVQLAAILQNTESGRILAEFNGMVITGGFPIPEVVTKIHGIDNELADRHGFPIEGVDQIFAHMIERADTVVAHNIMFDLGIVAENLPESQKIIITKQQFCTMAQSKEVLAIKKKRGSGLKNPRLIEAYRHFFGTDFDNAHDAMADVRACRDIYFKLVR